MRGAGEERRGETGGGGGRGARKESKGTTLTRTLHPPSLSPPTTTHQARVKSVERIVGPKATGETCHIIIETEGKIPFWEGQSYGVIPPGTKINSKGKEVRHGVRLYSIAASRYGDNFDGKTTSLCVRRATYWDPELKADDPAKKGICSNFLCDAKPGDEIEMTGPTGKVLLMPEDQNAVLIMVATGTGIAPFRSFWRRCFLEDVPNYRFTGLAWLFMGVANSDAKLYDDELREVLATYPDQFRLDYALSRESTNARGGKMYIQVSSRQGFGGCQTKRVTKTLTHPTHLHTNNHRTKWKNTRTKCSTSWPTAPTSTSAG